MAPPGTHSIPAAASSTRCGVQELTRDHLSLGAGPPTYRSAVVPSLFCRNGTWCALTAAVTAAPAAAAAASPRARTGRPEANPARAAPPAAPPFMIELTQDWVSVPLLGGAAAAA